MLKAALAGFGITVGLLLIPLVHFVSGPLGPFIGGFIGGSMVRARPSQGIIIGGLMGSFVAIPAILIVAMLTLATDILKDNWQTALNIIVIGVAFYITFLGSIGAIAGGHMARNKAASTETTER